MEGWPTSMKCLVKKTRVLPRRFGGARVQMLSDSSPRVLASRLSLHLYQEYETSLSLPQTREWF
jgi:hypothetical protein